MFKKPFNKRLCLFPPNRISACSKITLSAGFNILPSQRRRVGEHHRYLITHIFLDKYQKLWKAHAVQNVVS
jgi:hypothetical protein